jgi:RNA polymerase sigma-70 factor, ECF subfamily
LRAYRNLTQLRDPDRFAPWLAGIARQVARERRRALRRDRHIFCSDQPDLESTDDATAALDNHDQLDIIMRNVAKLPVRERLAIHTYFLQQQNAEHAAELVGLSRSGFYALLQRSLARLLMQLRPPTTKTRTR